MRFLKNGATALLLLLFYIVGQGAAFVPPHEGGATNAVAALTAEELAAITELGEAEETFAEGVRVSSRFYELFGGASKSEEVYLALGGDAFGLRLREAGVCVSEVTGSSALKAGDRIMAVDGRRVDSPEEIELLVRSSSGKPVTLVVARGDEELTISLTPRLEEDGYKLGATLRSATAGIGTLTFFDPASGFFGGLGHGVSAAGGELLPIKSGVTTEVLLGGIKKGEAGKPGELSGVLGSRATGSVYANTECGIFGFFDSCENYEAELVPVGGRAELHEGEAEIISSVKSGKRARYKIQICDIDRDSEGSKSFKIKVTDPTLIAITGGIVRGMSGSPIIQGGKLVGAVTHVMVADPTEGYGIFIENMLNAANNASNSGQKAA